MEYYEDILKEYSCNLNNKSIILKLLDIGRCKSLLEVRGLISNCKWEKHSIVDVYNFNHQDITQNCELFYCGILIETSLKIIEIIQNDNIYDIIVEGVIEPKIISIGISLFVNNIKIGNIINLNLNKISISCETNDIDRDIINNFIIAELNIYSVKNYNKGIGIFLPVIQMNNGKWAYDCIIDKKSYENDNKLCFNLLDDINLTNACGIISIGLIGAFISTITYNTIRERKKEKEDNVEEDKKLLINILNKIKKININHKENELYSNDDSSDINSNEKNNLDSLEKSITDLGLSTEMNEFVNNLQKSKNTSETTKENEIIIFNKQYNKIKSLDYVNFENEFIKTNINLKFKNIGNDNNEDDEKINNALHYIDLLNKF